MDTPPLPQAAWLGKTYHIVGVALAHATLQTYVRAIGSLLTDWKWRRGMGCASGVEPRCPAYELESKRLVVEEIPAQRDPSMAFWSGWQLALILGI